MKKLQIIAIIALSYILMGSTACSAKGWDCATGNKKVKTEKRNIGNYSSIEVGGAFEVFLTKSNEFSLVVEADENLHSLIITEVKDGVLHIRSKENICNAKAQIIRLSLPTFNAIKASGAAELESKDAFEMEKLELSISGASEVELNVNTKLVVSKLSGASELELAGKADTHAIDMSGASELDAESFMVNKYAIECSGASECAINVSDELNVKASGASEVKYTGKPSTITKSLSGASELKGR